MLKIERIKASEEQEMVGYSVECVGSKPQLVLELGVLMKSIPATGRGR